MTHASHSAETRPNTAIESPHAMIESTTARPWRRTCPSGPEKIPESTAPTAGEAASRPTAVAAILGSSGNRPTAIAGNSARGMPNTIATMST